MADVTCGSCGHEVPEGAYCVRCGAPLGAGTRRSARHRREFAAAPHESVHVPAVISSLFPHLPRSSMRSFRVALGAGAALVLLLGLLGLFPVAFLTAALLVPGLVVLYLHDANVYEDDVGVGVALTLLLGAVLGVVLGVVVRHAAPSMLIASTPPSAVVWRGVIAPIGGLALALAGPLLLRRTRRFDHVLDGVTLCAASAVAFASAQVLTQGTGLFDAGLRPLGSVGPWLTRLLGLSVAFPVLMAAVLGATGGAIWWRLDPEARPPLGLGLDPASAATGAAALLVITALGLLYLPGWAALVIQVGAALVALVQLRRLIHLGLIESTREGEIGPEVTCANCGGPTPHHSFCIHCGIAMRALPKPRAFTPPKPGTSGAPRSSKAGG